MLGKYHRVSFVYADVAKLIVDKMLLPNNALAVFVEVPVSTDGCGSVLAVEENS